MLLPASPGWVSLPVVVGGPRHSWLGSAGGGGVWCVVCGVLVVLWLVCGVVGPSPLLAVVLVCYSPPLLAGFRCRWWWAVPATPGWGPLAAVVCGVWCVACGVWRWCVGGLVADVWCGWSLASSGCGSCVLLPATPASVSLPVVVGGPRHSWLGSAGGGAVWCVMVVCWWGGGWCVVWLVPRHSWRRFLCATPRHSWLGFAAGGGGRSPPLLAGVRLRRWCVVCGLWCVVCGGGVLVGLRLVCGVVGPSPLLAEVPVCYSPPLLAGFRCRWWWAVPATPGWGPLAAVVCGVWFVVCGVWRWCVGGVEAGVWCGWSLATPGGGSCVLLPATPGWVSLPVVVGGPRHSWLGSARGGGVWCVVCGVWRWCVGGVVAGVWCGWSLTTPGGGSCVLLPASPGWVSLPVVVGGPRHSWLGSAGGGGVWCVVCGALVELWLVCGVVGPSPLLAVVLVCYSPPLLAGFRCRWWWAVPATPDWGPLAAVVCGVWCVAVVCRWACGLCVVWLVPRLFWRWFLCATPRLSWLGFAAGGGGRSAPLLAGVRWRRWCVVCGVWRWCVGAVVAGVWCGWSLAVCVSPLVPFSLVLVCVWVGFRLRPATPGWGVGLCACSACTQPLLATGARCGCVCLGSGFGCAPQLLAGVLGCVRAPLAPSHSWHGCAVWVCVFGLGFRLRPATPGWGVGLCACPACTQPLLARVRGVGVCVWALVSAAPRHSWLGCWAVVLGTLSHAAVRVCVCVPCLAGSGGPASRARFGAPHLSFGLSWFALCLFGPLRAGLALFVVVVGFFFFSFSSSLRPRCVPLCVFSGPGCLGPWRLLLPPPPPLFFFFPPPSVSPVDSCFACFPAPGALGLCVSLPPPPPFFFLLPCGAVLWCPVFFFFLPAGGAGFLLFPVGSGLVVLRCRVVPWCPVVPPC